MQGQMGSVSREVGNPKKEPKRNATDKKKHHRNSDGPNRLDGPNWLDVAGEGISALDDISTESLKTEKERKQRLKKNSTKQKIQGL